MAKEDSSHALLNIEQRVYDLVIPPMRELDFFAGMDTKDIMLYAAAIGARRDMKIPLKNPHGGGYSRKDYLKPREKVLIQAMQFADGGYQDPEVLRDYPAALGIFEEYANGGFQFIEAELDRNVSSEELANAAIIDLEVLYKEYMGMKDEEDEDERGEDEGDEAQRIAE